MSRGVRSPRPDRKNACRSTCCSTRRPSVPMHHFAYRIGVMHAEAFADVPSLVCYAMKANSNQAVIATLARLGAGADVVSGGELKRALAAGIPAEKIMFSGIGKTAEELAAALDAGILCINVESEPEP